MTVDPPDDPGPGFPAFDDVTLAAGIEVRHGLHEWYFVTGQAWGDFDRDGWMDLYVTDQVGPNTLFRNRGDGTFEVSPQSAQVALPNAVSGGAVFVDYDNDGWSDLMVVNWGANTLFHNDGGLGFTDVTRLAGMGDTGVGMSATFGDYDNDGLLDCYVANWADLDATSLVEGMRDRLYRNRGDGTFEDVTSLLGSQNETAGFAFIAGFLDYDNDGDQDIYLVNDKGSTQATRPDWPMNRCCLWRNDVVAGGGFVERAVAAGADLRLSGMGIAVGDYDNDGFLDMAVSNQGPSKLLHNDGDGTFSERGVAAGIDDFLISWGLFFADVDNDRWPDLYIAASDQGSRMFENARDGTFTDVSVASRTDDPAQTIGAAYCDYDRDGWLDFVVGNRGSGYRLYRNTGLAAHGHWFRVRLEGSGAVNRDAVGTRVVLRTSAGATMQQEVACGSSVSSGHDMALHFGLGDDEVDELQIRWPDGLVETFTGLTRDQEWFRRHP